MKIRTDVIRMYKEVHSWVGIVAGLGLFIAFYAGAITMFEDSLQRWASPPSTLGAPPPLERTPDLIAKLLAVHPEAARSYDVNLRIDGNRPARVSWSTGGRGEDEHGPRKTFYATLDGGSRLIVSERQPSGVAQFVDVLHQQLGLPLSHNAAMPIVGIVSLLYAIALVSGTVVLLPSLVSDLFTVRIGRNLKRMWLDVHNVLGLFSLPFHIIMALTAIVFAFHDQFYDLQGMAFGRGERPARSAAAPSASPPLTPAEIVAAVRRQAPGFEPVTLGYSRSPEGKLTVRVAGTDSRYGLRGPTAGFAGVDPYTGRIEVTDYMPGKQDGWSAAITSFFALHFGNFGGVGVRWAYVLLGLAGAALFYTGNLLWVESRRKRERKAGAVEQTRATRILGALTVGVSLGCIGGISATIAAAKIMGAAATPGAHSAIYYAIFTLFVIWALVRGAARAGFEVAVLSAIATLAIPLASLGSGRTWYQQGASGMVDLVATMLAVGLILIGTQAKRRAAHGPGDSIWSGKLRHG